MWIETVHCHAERLGLRVHWTTSTAPCIDLYTYQCAEGLMSPTIQQRHGTLVQSTT